MRDLPRYAPLAKAGAHPALVLNADHTPLQLFPLSIWPWTDAIKAVWLDRVTVLAEHDVVVHSPSIEMRKPAVLIVRQYVRHRRWPAFTNSTIKLRDRGACGYCGHRFPTAQLTIDHVVPRSRGGPHRWENVISACERCNFRKDDKLCSEVGMMPLWRPWRPTPEELHRASRRFQPGNVPISWEPYVCVEEGL